MGKISDILRSRLRATGEWPAEHPDPNVLAAFAERTLLARERAVVTAHLAGCADCREYLAVAQTAAIMPRQKEAPAVHWWRWATIAATAAACVVLVVVLRRHPEPPPATQLAKVVVPAVPEVPKAREAAPLVAEVKKPKGAATDKRAATSPQAAPQVALEAQSEAEPQQRQQASNLAVDAAAPVQVESSAAAPPVAEVRKPKETAITKRAANPPQVALEAHSQAKTQLQQQASDRAVDAAAPRPAAQPANKDGLPGPGANRLAAGEIATGRAAPGVRWSINAAGAVERSLDAGTTWEVVPVGDGVTFRAVAAAGNEVWAGGSNGAVFHSSDGGLHWVQSVKLAGAIVSIDAGHPAHAKVTTRSGEVWSSTDGGRNWKPQ